MEKKSVRRVIIFLFLFILVGIFAVWRFRSSSPPFVVTSDLFHASKDQTQLINGFGYPDTFVLAMEGKERLEVWNYYGLKRSFVFREGKFISDQIIDSLESFDAYPRLRPTQFKKEMTLEQANVVIDSQPTSQADTIDEVMKGSTVYNYSDQVIVGIQEGKVVFVQTLPVKTKLR